MTRPEHDAKVADGDYLARPEYRCTDCGWTGDYDEIDHLRAGEDDILDQCPECEAVESMALNKTP